MTGISRRVIIFAHHCCSTMIHEECELHLIASTLEADYLIGDEKDSSPLAIRSLNNRAMNSNLPTADENGLGLHLAHGNGSVDHLSEKDGHGI